MARKPISDVPPREVGRVVQDFIDDGVAKVDAEEQTDGLFTVTPDPESPENGAGAGVARPARRRRGRRKSARGR